MWCVCVCWQVTLCDITWQVMLYNFEMGSREVVCAPDLTYDVSLFAIWFLHTSS